jgi:FHS family L-fucose permease-like MFS transporter
MAQATPIAASDLTVGAEAATGAERNHTRSLVIITILFFMWGLLTSLNDVLIPHLKSVYELNYVQAMLVQFCFFGAYFIVSVPAGTLVRRIGYQSSAVAGLVVAALGCALFYPAANSGYALFLFALFVLAAGITVLQVAANPYVTVLGQARTASSRLTLTQAFNSLGTTVGPLFGSVLILSGGVLAGSADPATMSAADLAAHHAKAAEAVQMPYLALSAALLLLAVLFALARLPKISHGDDGPAEGPVAAIRSVLGHPNLFMGAIAIFVYVGAEVSIGSFLVNFFAESHIASLPAADAAKLVSYYWGFAMVGRFIGFAVMRTVSPGRALAFNAACSMALILVAITGHGPLAMWAILGVGLFNSIMFPTIFSMALHRLGAKTGRGSGILCMAIVGGAIVPFLQGALADRFGVQLSFWLPWICYGYILYFGLKFARLYQAPEHAPAG